MSFPAVFVLTASLVAAAMDVGSGRVKNRWIVILWMIGLIYRALGEGSLGIARFLAGSLFPIGILFPLFRFRMLGPGDIKLFSALGGVMGVRAVAVCVAVSFFSGGVLAVWKLFISGDWISRLRYFTEYIQKTIRNRKIIPYYVPGDRPENLHFTVAILVGAVLYAGGYY